MRANRDCDLLVVPSGSHAMDQTPYLTRQRRDHVVQHLLGLTPPAASCGASPPCSPRC